MALWRMLPKIAVLLRGPCTTAVINRRLNMTSKLTDLPELDEPAYGFMDPRSKMVHYDRTIFITGRVMEEEASHIISKLFYLHPLGLKRPTDFTPEPPRFITEDVFHNFGGSSHSERIPLDPMDSCVVDHPIQLIINSDFISWPAALAIYDVMKLIQADNHTLIKTVGVGACRGLAPLILFAGSTGWRGAYYNTGIAVGQIDDDAYERPDIQERLGSRIFNYKETFNIQEEVKRIYQSMLNQDAGEIKNMLERVAFQSIFIQPVVAQQVGLIDVVIS